LDIHVYWNILTMHGPINVKSPNNTSKWQMGFNSAFKGLINFNLFPETIHLIFSLLFSELNLTELNIFLLISK
jgi:hypothetical protein